jgi:hypothetical protein
LQLSGFSAENCLKNEQIPGPREIEQREMSKARNQFKIKSLRTVGWMSSAQRNVATDASAYNLI